MYNGAMSTQLFTAIAIVVGIYSLMLMYHWFKFTMRKEVVTVVSIIYTFGVLLLLFILLMAALALTTVN